MFQFQPVYTMEQGTHGSLKQKCLIEFESHLSRKTKATQKHQIFHGNASLHKSGLSFSFGSNLFKQTNYSYNTRNGCQAGIPEWDLYILLYTVFNRTIVNMILKTPLACRNLHAMYIQIIMLECVMQICFVVCIHVMIYMWEIISI